MPIKNKNKENFLLRRTRVEQRKETELIESIILKDIDITYFDALPKLLAQNISISYEKFMKIRKGIRQRQLLNKVNKL